MLKAYAELPDEGLHLTVLGLSDANTEKMKRDNPVVFPLSELIDGRKEIVVVSCAREHDGRCAAPKDLPDMLLIAISEIRLDTLDQSPKVLQADDLKFFIFRGESELAMEDMVHGLLGPNTLVTHKGYSPSAIPPSRN